MRHGQTDWNAQRRLQGTLDVPINATGRAQALRNGGMLAELICGKGRFNFVSSPLLRARETMEIVRSAIGLPAGGYRTDDRLQEISFGAWGGFTWAEIEERDPEGYARRQADPWNETPPEGQCFRDFHAQAVAWFGEVASDTIVVGHGGTSRCLRGHVLKLTPREFLRLEVAQDKVLLFEGETVTSL